MNREKLLRRLRDRTFRRAFAEEAVDVGIPIQIREMRRARGWTQNQLGAHAGIHQEQVALAEKLSYGRFTLATLKKLAAAFDCALIVRFATFSELLRWKDSLDEASVTPQSFEADMELLNSEPINVLAFEQDNTTRNKRGETVEHFRPKRSEGTVTSIDDYVRRSLGPVSQQRMPPRQAPRLSEETVSGLPERDRWN